MKKQQRKRIWRRTIALLLAIALVMSDGGLMEFFGGSKVMEAQAAGSTIITTMDYFDNAGNGPNHSCAAVGTGTFGFVLPKFNGKPSQELDLPAVEGDLELLVWQAKGTEGKWKNINDVSEFKWTENWGWEHQYWDGGSDGWIAWFKVSETTKLRFHGKTKNVTLEYTLNFTPLSVQKLTSISAKIGSKKASETGSSGIDQQEFIYNGNESVTYEQVENDIEVLVKRDGESSFVPLLNNANAGWIYDQNFGIYTDGNGGWWFNEQSAFTLRLQSKSNSNVRADIRVEWTAPDRSSGRLSHYDGKSKFDARPANNTDPHTAAIAICLPKINGTAAMQSELDKFVYEVCVGATYNASKDSWSGGKWVPLEDVESNWIYQANGYSEFSSKQQWGYWFDYIYGLWFQPVKENTYLRIGFPSNPQKSDAINDNYVYYTFIGDPQAIVPDMSAIGDISYDKTTGDTKNDHVTEEEANQTTPDGWKMIWHDEFNGKSVNTNNWTNQTGFLINPDDIGTAGWGNAELEWYTDSDRNTSVSDGKLKFTLRKEPKVFSDTHGRTATAQYSSGKLISQHKFSVKYGRVDFRAKLPGGTGIWPALWMMPNDDVYGGWACSGEIDIMEGRGRTPEVAFGTVHYGGAWPGNTSTGNTMDMVSDGNVKSDMTDWHIYSLVWEEGDLKMYADGKCYFRITSDKFYSAAAGNNKNAPFDQRFYLIMNLAAGGWFDGGRVPDDSTFDTKEMYVDYVRVYQREVGQGKDEKNDKEAANGTNDGLYGDYKTLVKAAAQSVSLDQKSLTMKVGEETTLQATVLPVNAGNKKVRWVSSDESVLHVDNGKLKANKAGNAIVKVITEDGGHEAECKVTVTEGGNNTGGDNAGNNNSGDNNSGDNNSGDNNSGGSSSEDDSNKKEMYTVTFDSQGGTEVEEQTVVEGDSVLQPQVPTKTGYIFKGWYLDGVKYTFRTAVTENITLVAKWEEENTETKVEVEGVTLNVSEITLTEGESRTLIATVTPEDATHPDVTWSSSDTDCVRVDVDGVIAAKKAGTADVIVTTLDGGYQATCKVVVKAKQNMTEPGDGNGENNGGDNTATPDGSNEGTQDGSDTTTPGGSNTTTPGGNNNVTPGESNNVTPGGSNTTTPGGNNNVTPGGNNAGTPDGNNTEIKVKKIKVSGISKQIAAGKSVKLTAKITPQNANASVIWKSSNRRYATVNSKGVVKTKKAGKNKNVTIMATAKDGSGVVGEFKIKIMSKAVKVLKIKTSDSSVKAGGKIYMKAFVTPNLSAKKINKTIKWSSSNAKYATVNSKGVVKTKKAGKNKKVTITAMTTDGSNKRVKISIRIK